MNKKISMKSTIIKWLMKLNEREPQFEKYYVSEIFRHNSFINGTEKEKQKIMHKSSDKRYLDEFQNSIQKYFSIDLTPFLKNKIMLDLGCFTGGRPIAWAEKYKINKVYGIDVKKIFLHSAKNYANHKGIEAEFATAVGENLPFKGKQFDAVISYDVFEHVQDVEKVLKETLRVLKAGGVLIVVFPGYYQPNEHHLGAVTTTPFLHWFFAGKSLVQAFNKILEARGDRTYWYRREITELQPWERCKGINGMTSWRFRKLLKDSNWETLYKRPVPIFKLKAKQNGNCIAKVISSILVPFSYIVGFEELINSRIVYILQKL